MYRYIGVVTENVFNLNAHVQWDTTVAFQWKAQGHSFNETHIVQGRCLNFVQRSVAFPPHWRTALKLQGISCIVDESVKEARERFEMPSMQCILLGQPKDVLIPESQEHVTGAILRLQSGEALFEYLLCAHVREQSWLCHRGTFNKHEIDKNNPFDAKDLVIKDISAHDEMIPPPRKRIRGHLHCGQLRAFALKRLTAFKRVVALAQWKAEEIRSAEKPFDEAVACRGFEQNHWNWKDHNIKIVAMWSWLSGTKLHKQIVETRVDHLLDRGLPYPSGFVETDDCLLQRLNLAAAEETTKGKAPCRYLGLHVGAQCFEPNPSKWPSRHYTQEGKSHAIVYFEWLFVCRDQAPHRVQAKVNKVLYNKQRIPGHPLKSTANSQLKFSIEFMHSVAKNIHEGVQYKGIVFEGDDYQFILEVPNNGIDIQEEPAHWILPSGQSICTSVRQIAEIQKDQLFANNEEEAYREIAQMMGYHALGHACDSDLEAFRENPGTLSEKVWERCPWTKPADETASCWWVANAAETDKTQKVKLICRSLTVLRLDLHSNRCATTTKLRQERERRLENNALAIDVLNDNQHLWRHVNGPDTETLLNPSENNLGEARAAVERLRELIDARGPNENGLEIFAKEIEAAVNTLKIASWEAIRVERFTLTPKGLYDELVRNVQCVFNKREGEAARRKARLKSDDDSDCEDEPVERQRREPGPDLFEKDKYSLNIDQEFKCTSSRKPNNLNEAIKMASEVHLDEMRTLLELHYDNVHLERWMQKDNQKRAPARKGKHKVFASVAYAHRKKLNQRLVLPRQVKEILQEPEDEERWEKLEKLRHCIVCVVQEETVIECTMDEKKRIINAIKNCKSNFPNELGAGCKLPEGARIQIEWPISDDSSIERAAVIAAIENQNEEEDATILNVFMRPFFTDRGPPMDDMCKAMSSTTSMKDIAKHWPKGELTIGETLDRMLLVLWDGLFMKQAQTWTDNSVANLKCDETFELARWFLWGHQIGSKPLFDGICAQCGALLHGNQNQNCANSNKRTGPPSDRDGKPLQEKDGISNVEAQPPFLLRYSPSLFAKEAPAMFIHNPETNCLSLHPRISEPPWIKPQCPRSDEKNSWLYCIECQERWFPAPNQKMHSHVPYRDKASQSLLKPMKIKKDNSASDHKKNTSEEPDAEPPAAEDPSDEEYDNMLELKDPPEERPTLEEYEEKWQKKCAWHARPVAGTFSRNNLIPTPIPQLWQDCPYVPFDELKSNEAQARLSVCRPVSGLEPASCVNGIPRYAHNTGDVNFRRRAPLQVASTLGFVLNKRSGKFLGLSSIESNAVHECLTWGRQEGNNKVLAFFGTVLESFQSACGTLMARFNSVIPEGCHRARIRATRRETRDPKEGVLSDTLGEEAHGMVIVDGGGHPMRYETLNVLEDVVATQTSRIEIDIPAEGGRGWQRTNSVIDTQNDKELNEVWRQNLSTGASHLRNETYVTANEPHYDAKTFVHMHPYGTGSLLAEPGSGGTQRHARNRLTLIQSCFRRSALWGFWYMSRLLQTELFFKNKRRREGGRPTASAAEDTDPVTRFFGTTQPTDIPETSEWWKRQQRDLFTASS
eukprot:12431531-Karenia_brevis.AAC.1